MAKDEVVLQVLDVRTVDFTDAKGPDSVRTPGPQYEEMRKQGEWKMLDDLLGGTRTMRLAGELWLPKQPREENQSYANRIRRSFLFEAYKDTIKKLVSKPFSQPVTLKEADNIDPRLQTLENNVDGEGRSVSEFGRDVFTDALNRGVSHIFVDFSRTEGGQSIIDEREGRARPTWQHVRAEDLIGWRFDEQGLEQIRILEKVWVPVGAFGQKEVEQVRVVTREKTMIFRKMRTSKKQDVFQKIDEAPMTLGVIPLITVYFNQTGQLTALPPMLPLAWLNVEHWQSKSDQANILRFARTGMYFMKGVSKEEAKDIVIGPNQLVTSSNDAADMKVVEYEGTSIEAGDNDLKRIEQLMEVLGLSPLVERAAFQQTATRAAINEGRSDTIALDWIRQTEGGLRSAFLLSAKWLGVQLTEEFDVDIFNDFGVMEAVAQEVALLLQSCEKGKLSLETYLREAKRRGVLSDSVDIESEIERIQAGGSPLDLIGSFRVVDEETEEEEEEEQETEEGVA